MTLSHAIWLFIVLVNETLDAVYVTGSEEFANFWLKQVVWKWLPFCAEKYDYGDEFWRDMLAIKPKHLGL